MRESDVTTAAVHFLRNDLLERGATAVVVIDRERGCQLDVPMGSKRGARRGRPDGLVLACLEARTFVASIESKTLASAAHLLPDSAGSLLLAPGSRTGSAMEQAAAYPADFRVLALGCEIFEEAPELEAGVRAEAERLGLGLLVVHGREWVDVLVPPSEHPCDGLDWLTRYSTGAALREELARAGSPTAG